MRMLSKTEVIQESFKFVLSTIELLIAYKENIFLIIIWLAVCVSYLHWFACMILVDIMSDQILTSLGGFG